MKRSKINDVDLLFIQESLLLVVKSCQGNYIDFVRHRLTFLQNVLMQQHRSITQMYSGWNRGHVSLLLVERTQRRQKKPNNENSQRELSPEWQYFVVGAIRIKSSFCFSFELRMLIISFIDLYILHVVINLCKIPQRKVEYNFTDVNARGLGGYVYAWVAGASPEQLLRGCPSSYSRSTFFCM